MSKSSPLAAPKGRGIPQSDILACSGLSPRDLLWRRLLSAAHTFGCTSPTSVQPQAPLPLSFSRACWDTHTGPSLPSRAVEEGADQNFPNLGEEPCFVYTAPQARREGRVSRPRIPASSPGIERSTGGGGAGGRRGEEAKSAKRPPSPCTPQNGHSGPPLSSMSTPT